MGIGADFGCEYQPHLAFDGSTFKSQAFGDKFSIAKRARVLAAWLDAILAAQGPRYR